MRRTLMIVTVVVALVAGAAAVGFIYYRANPDQWESFLEEMRGESETSSAPQPKERAKDGDNLQASGTIEVEEVTISSLTGGKVDMVYVDEGDEVQAGDLLLQLDVRAPQAQRAVLEANVAQAEAAVTAAQSQLDMARARPTSEELAAANGAVKAAAAQVDIARAGLQGIQAAVSLGERPEASTDQELVAAEARVEAAEGQLEQAQAQLVQVSTGATTYELELLKAQLDQAVAAREAAEASLRALDLEIENMSLQAPMDSTVLQRLINPGEIAAPGGALFLLADLDRLTLTVYVPEADLGRVALGQDVEVTVDASSQVFQGQVSHIASSAEFTPRNIQTQEERVHMVFAVRISLDNPEGILKPGMPADVVFLGD